MGSDIKIMIVSFWGEKLILYRFLKNIEFGI